MVIEKQKEEVKELYDRKKHKEFMKRFKEKNPNGYNKIKVLSKYVKSNEKILVECRKCGYKWEVLPTLLIQDKAYCLNCKGKYKRRTPKEFREQLYNINPNIELLTDFEKVTIKLKCKCKVCGCEWEAAPDKLINKHQGCPDCHKKNQTSLFEQIIYYSFVEVLGNDKVFNRDKSLGKEIDVYIPSLHIAYEPGGWVYHKTAKALKKDKEKYELCSLNNIKLTTIYYYMGNDINKEFNYDVIKYKDVPTTEEMVEFVKSQFRKNNIRYKNINWDKIIAKAKSNCTGLTTEDFKERMNKLNPDLEVVGEYINSRTKIKCKCKICGEIIEKTPNMWSKYYTHKCKQEGSL